MLPENYDSRTKIDTDQVCEFFGITKNTVSAWVRKGKIPTPVLMGGKNWWRYKDIIACEDMMFQAGAKNVRGLGRRA